MNRNELFSKINTQIVDKLKEGVVPWKKSWISGVPVNFISKRPYHGVNFLSLSLMDYGSPYYLTFLQCKERGGTVLSGSKSQMVVYWKVLEYGTDNNDRISEDGIKKIPFIRYSNVFNISQTSLNSEEGNKTTLLECEKILAGMKVKPVIKNNISRCYYDPVGDYISLPKVSDFKDETEYWSSLFHELIHWSGIEDRLKRIKALGYSKEEYSFEELVAEIGSSYLSALCGISPKVVDNQISYIDGWMRLSKEEENIFPRAAAEASKAVEYILGDSAIC